MKDPKILIIAGGLAALLFSTKAKASTSTNKKLDNLTPEPDGELGEPPGPGGKCKTGFILKDGICQLPSVDDDQDDPKDGNQSGNGSGSGGSKSPSSLVISAKCDNFTFGDGTGESWWKNIGEKTAKQWTSQGWEDSLRISYGMLQKSKPVCFTSFPFEEKFDEKWQYYYELVNWIRKYPKIWELVWFVRNKIDEKFFEGKTTVVIDPKTMKIRYGKEFDNDLWIADVVTPFAGFLINIEKNEPSFLLDNEKDGDEWEQVFDNVTTYIYSILFPNLDIKIIKSRYDKGLLQKDPVWKEIRSHFSVIGDVDIEGDA